MVSSFRELLLLPAFSVFYILITLTSSVHETKYTEKRLQKERKRGREQTTKKREKKKTREQTTKRKEKNKKTRIKYRKLKNNERDFVLSLFLFFWIKVISLINVPSFSAAFFVLFQQSQTSGTRLKSPSDVIRARFYGKTEGAGWKNLVHYERIVMRKQHMFFKTFTQLIWVYKYLQHTYCSSCNLAQENIP